jgi:sucrose-6-phosphate hydrolase SacC (GH32 family)
VEVFANRGAKVMTDRSYPPQDSWRIEMYANGGAGKVVSLTIWPMASIWEGGK